MGAIAFSPIGIPRWMLSRIFFDALRAKDARSSSDSRRSRRRNKQWGIRKLLRKRVRLGFAQDFAMDGCG
jgi:hypothetical protein